VHFSGESVENVLDDILPGDHVDDDLNTDGGDSKPSQTVTSTDFLIFLLITHTSTWFVDQF